ncbi:hypothetical protein ACH4UV_38460 [Streptomyces sp. NPDC020802]|uniref:hypothetical protein n=1 Tax=Streptomyces sp. NPDC020802 TaxID=3365094 RepID=UPI0037885104
MLIAVVLSVLYFTLLFGIPQLTSDRAGWPTGPVAVGQMIAMIAGSVLTFGFAAVSGRLGQRKVRALLLGVGALAAVAAVFSHSVIVLFIAIGLAVFTATGANAPQSMAAASAVPEPPAPHRHRSVPACLPHGRSPRPGPGNHAHPQLSPKIRRRP